MGITRLLTHLSAAALWLGTTAGCTVSPDANDRFDPPDTPGGSAWNTDPNVSCTTNEECGDGETCEDGICQMKRCGEPFESVAPMGDNYYFGTDGEYAVISDNAFIDAFEPTSSSYINSWDLQGEGVQVVDVAGGNLTGSRPHAVAAAVAFSSTVLIRTPEGMQEFDVGIWPRAIAVGDVDFDGVDELVAFAEDGSISACDVDEGTCLIAQITADLGKDVAIADIDGDGYEEPIFLVDQGDNSDVVVWNLDADETGQEDSFGWGFNFPVVALGAGNLNGEVGGAQIVALEDGGWWGWTSDKVHVFDPATESFVTTEVDGRTEDVAVGDRDSDDQDEIAVLRQAKSVALYRMDNGALSLTNETAITVGQDPQRISFLDWNGDSASGRLVEGPELVAGDAVPVAALMFPPYPKDLATGALSANITLGNMDSVDEEYSDTLSLSVGMGLSFGVEAGPFKAKVSGYFNRDVSVTQSFRTRRTIGARYWVLAQPQLQGLEYAPVIMSCGCYHRYRYQTEDPSNLIGGTGQVVDIFIPVGGQTQLWSSQRYNAMAAATGTLPLIEVPITVGDPSSYPATQQTLDGQPIAPDDMVFTDVPSYQVSDVGFVNYWLVRGETETNAVAETIDFGTKASFGLFGNGIDVSSQIGQTAGYSLSVGNTQIFAGGIPPVPDNPDTPEDEFLLNRYSFSPFVYRQRYTDAQGDEAAYYVMNFTVAQQQ